MNNKETIKTNKEVCMLKMSMPNYKLFFWDTYNYNYLIKNFSEAQRQKLVDTIVNNDMILVFSDDIFKEVKNRLNTQKEYDIFTNLIIKLSNNIIKIKKSKEIFYMESDNFLNDKLERKLKVKDIFTDHFMSLNFDKKNTLEKEFDNFYCNYYNNILTDIDEARKNDELSKSDNNRENIPFKKIKNESIEKVLEKLQDSKNYQEIPLEERNFTEKLFLKKEIDSSFLSDTLETLIQNNSDVKNIFSLLGFDNDFLKGSNKINDFLNQANISDIFSNELKCIDYIKKIKDYSVMNLFKKYVDENNSNEENFNKFKKQFIKNKPRESFLLMPAIHIDNLLSTIIERPGRYTPNNVYDRNHATIIPYVNLFYGDHSTLSNFRTTELKKQNSRKFIYRIAGHDVTLASLERKDKSSTDEYFNQMLQDLEELVKS